MPTSTVPLPTRKLTAKENEFLDTTQRVLNDLVREFVMVMDSPDTLPPDRHLAFLRLREAYHEFALAR